MLKFNDFGKVSKLETPFWYYDIDLFRRTVQLAASLSRKYGIGVHYALKANVEPRLVRYISSKGFGADCVSGNEVQYAAANGFRPDSIVFAGVGKSDREIKSALELGIEAFNVESLMEMRVIDDIASAMGVRANVSLRINPNIDAHTHRYVTTGLYENKFGISAHEFDSAISLIKESRSLDFKGLHFHIGSQITDVDEVYGLECERAAEIVSYFEDHGLEVGSIDLGGGLGVDYDDPDGASVPDFGKWFGIIDRRLRRRPGQLVSIEPGRSLVAQCGSLVTRVLFVKAGETKTFLIMDAGMNDLIRPALYGAYHKIENLTAFYRRAVRAGGDGEPVGPLPPMVRADVVQGDNKSSSDDDRSWRAVRAGGDGEPVGPLPPSWGTGGGIYDIVGPVCESSDVWGAGRELPLSFRGDLLAIRSAGAYGSVMSSRYNLRDLAPAYFSDDFIV